MDVLLIALTDGSNADWSKKNEVEGVAEVLDKFTEQYGLPADNILFSCIDEGCHYLLDEFIPKLGDRFQGPMHLPTGLYVPDISDFTWAPGENAELVKKFTLFLDFGASYSGLIKLVDDGITKSYKNNGFRVIPTEDPTRCENDPYLNRIKFWQEHITGAPYRRPAIGDIPCDEPISVSVDGVKMCETSLADIMVIYAVPDGRDPKQLAVFFHGDGGGALSLKFDRSLQLVAERDLLIVGMTADAFKESSNDRGPITSWAKKNCANGVREILEAFTDNYDLPRDKVLFSGVSGGAWYLTDELIPVLGDEFQGAFHIGCGGNRPSDRNFEWDPAALPAVRSKFKLHFDYGTGDFLTESIQQSIEYYRSKGFSVTTPNPLGDELHCGTDINGNRFSIWESNIVD